MPRNWPGAYVIFGDGVLVYIGQGGSVSKRISAHQIGRGYGASLATPWGIFNSVIVKVRYGRKLGDWAMREIRLIHRLQPRGNCVGSTWRRRPNGR